jgi:hypothetical protein
MAKGFTRQVLINKGLFLLAILFLVPFCGHSMVERSKKSLSANQTIKDYGLKRYVGLSAKLPHSEDSDWQLICQLPYNCQFQPWIKLKGIDGKIIRINSTNPLVINLVKTETYTTKAGLQVFEAGNWISGESVIYTIPAGVTVEKVQYRETGFNTKLAGSFECNDNDYNILWKKAARTAYLCMRDHFYDCPDRERLEFWGDGTPELGECFYAFDSTSHILCKDLVLKPLQKGFYPGQQLEFLGKYGLWFYYMQTGDLNSLRSVYEQTKNFLFYTYRYNNREQWFDWGINPKDNAVIEKCFMYIDLGILKKMAVVTKHESDIRIIEAKLDSIKNTFDRDYWKESYYRSDNVTSPDDRANAMAINAGLADSSKWELIYDNVLSQAAYSSNFFDRWVFEALCKMGKQEYALLRMYNRYKTMIPCSFTTLWEHYDRLWGDSFDPGSSLNHGWNPPIINLSQTITGIAPEEPGWGTFHIFPKEAFLNKIKAIIPTVKGNIQVKMEKDSIQYMLSVFSPSKTKMIVGIPRKSFLKLKTIKVNGITVWNGAYTGGVKGVSWYGENPEYIMFAATSGRWHFKGEGVLPITSPKPLPLPVSHELKLNKRHWVATASVRDSFFEANNEVRMTTNASNAIDGDYWTGWRDMTRKQYKGQWFQIDMREKHRFNKIVLDNTWALWDSPNKYAVTVSDDGTNWGTPIAMGSGQLGITTITFPLQRSRYIRITQTGTSPTYNWSIFELDVYFSQNINEKKGE